MKRGIKKKVTKVEAFVQRHKKKAVASGGVGLVITALMNFYSDHMTDHKNAEATSGQVSALIQQGNGTNNTLFIILAREDSILKIITQQSKNKNSQ